MDFWEEAGIDAIRGSQLALNEFNGQVAGRDLTIIVADTEGTASSAVAAAQKLVEEDGVDIVIGSIPDYETISIRDYLATQPNVTHMNGTSASLDASFHNAPSNFYSFSSNSLQWMAGLGDYAYNELGYRRVAIISEDWPLSYDTNTSFMSEFCQLGGEVVDQQWVAIGTAEYGANIAQIPVDVDAIFVNLLNVDAVNFLRQYREFGGTAPILAGTLVVDGTTLTFDTAAQADYIGTVSAGPISANDPNPEWQAWLAAYHELPGSFPIPPLGAYGYYLNTKAALTALEQVDGDLSNNHAAFHHALRGVILDSPTGPVRLDKDGGAIANTYLSQVVEDGRGGIELDLLKVVSQSPALVGLGAEGFRALGPLTRDNPSCADFQQ